MSEYYVSLNDQQTGPYDEDHLRQMLESGQVTEDHYVWKEGTPDWVLLRTLQLSKPKLKLQGQPIPPSMGAPPVHSALPPQSHQGSGTGIIARTAALAGPRLGFMERLSNSWNLMRASFQVLQANKSMLWLPLVSSLCAVLVLVSFAVPAFIFFLAHSSSLKAGDPHATVFNPFYLAYAFAFYFCNYVVIIFFNAALVACAYAHLQGQRLSLGDSLKSAASRLPAILGWAAIAATVGLLLHLIENFLRDKKFEFLARIVTGLLGAAWTIVTFLVLPALVIERVGPIMALKSSLSMIRRTWGEELIGNAGFGIVSALLSIPGILLIFLGAALGASSKSLVPFGVCVGGGVLYLVLMGLAQSAMKIIYQTALYLYARDSAVPQGFNEASLAGAFATKA